MLFQPEQIQKIISTFIRVSNFAANGNSANVTAQITAALINAGNGGTQVPLQVSTDVNTEGVIAAMPLNRVLVYDHVSGQKLTDNNGKEVFGRLSQAGGLYTLTFYTLDNTGVESQTAVNAAIDFEFAYRFSFEHLPADCTIFVQERNVSEDPGAAGGPRYADVWELLTITAQNTFNPLTFTPTASTDVSVYANGKAEDGFAGGAFSVNTVTKVITWNAANAGYNVKTTYRCYAVYKTQLA